MENNFVEGFGKLATKMRINVNKKRFSGSCEELKNICLNSNPFHRSQFCKF